jgi:hypothetical protein
MEADVVRELGKKALLGAAAMVLGVGGSAAFTGTALAGEDHGCGCDTSHHDSWGGWGGQDAGWSHPDADHTHGVGGNGGSGGQSNANCLIPVGVSAGVIGQGGPASQCNAVGGGGGNGGAGVG